MNVLDKYLQEITKPKILYHSSNIQGIKFLDPEKNESSHLKYLKKYIYATDDKSYAAGFCFEWSSNDRIRFGQHVDDGPWVIEIPKVHLIKLKVKCSIYTVDSKGFKKVYGLPTPEFYSKEKVPVLSEEKYNSARECLEKNNVVIKVT
jgi:hypothetical protein